MEQLAQVSNGLQFGEITAFGKFLESVGCSRTTGWRWRKLGWIKTLPISGRPYVRREEIDRFLARAQAGEFAQTPCQQNGGAQ